MKTLKRILISTGKYRILLVISLLLSVFSVAAALYIPVLAGRAVDLIAAKDGIDFVALKKIILRIAVTAASAGAVQWITNRLNNRVTYRTVRDIRNKAQEKISRLPVSYIDSHSTGDIVSRIISDADQFADGLLMGFTQLFTGVLTIAGTLIFMLRINMAITAVVVILTPLSLLVAKFVAGRTHSMFLKQSEARGKQTTIIDEAVSGKKVIAAYGAENEITGRFDEINEEFCDYSLKAIFFSSITNPSTRFVNNTIYACVALAGSLAVISTGAMTVGGLSCFLAYAGQYAKPFNEISGVVTEFQNALACAERLFEFIDSEEEPAETDLQSIENASGRIRFDSVSFSYDKSKELIRDLNLSVSAGEKVAIVGPTGCGKTTIINLLMRFYDVDGGSISIDGTDIRSITKDSLRSSYGMVLQETWIKTGTVRDNIALAKPDATEEEVVSAAKSVHAHAFIKRLPEGYNTVISDGTTEISQGQKQLICIARLMLLNPSVIILDEATSSIDTRTEIKIRNAFDLVSKGKPCFIVAHRLSTIRNSDVILVMKDGSIIEQANHDELMAKHGFYEELYNSRTK